MKHHESGLVTLELSEIIRVNQLIRGRIDFNGFRHWYDSLSVPEQCALIATLMEFAYQARFDEQIFKEAVSAAQVDPDNPFVILAASPDELEKYVFAQGYHIGYFWLLELDDSDRFAIFSLFVCLFGKAEGKRYQECEKDKCGAWWHRNLLDERVVKAILNDPHFYRICPRDDNLVKQK